MFDYIVIGSGPGGLALAYQLKARDFNVAVIENDKWGGTCPNYGCDPTKAMMAVVEAKHHADQLQGQGLKGNLTVDWAAMRNRKVEITDPYAKQSFEGLKANGIETIYGTAVFTDDGMLLVGQKRYQADHYVIATGTRPRALAIEGGELLNNSNDFLDLDELPEEIVFLGLGPIGLELAQLANAAGAHVTIISITDLEISNFQKTVGADYLTRLQADGINFEANIAINKVEQTERGLLLSDGKQFEIFADYAVAGVGRIPNIEQLNLEKMGVKSGRGGVIVDEFLRTSNPNIYALGDVVQKKRPHLTPVSVFEGNYLGANLGNENARAIDYPVIPYIIYGPTKLAQVGEFDQVANVSKKILDMTNWYTYKRIADPLAKIVVAINQHDQIVGASIISTVADELINLLTFAIQRKVSLDEMNTMIMAYPTVASDLSYFY